MRSLWQMKIRCYKQGAPMALNGWTCPTFVDGGGVRGSTGRLHARGYLQARTARGDIVGDCLMVAPHFWAAPLFAFRNQSRAAGGGGVAARYGAASGQFRRNPL